MSKEEFIEKIKEIKINVPDEDFFWKYNLEIYKILDKKEELQQRIDEAIESIKNIKPLSLEETALKESIKQAYYESSYIKNCKESFDMICHLEDFEIAVWNILDILKREE